MYHNLRRNARGRQGRRSNANISAASEAESLDGVVAYTSLEAEAGEHGASKKKVSSDREWAPPPTSEWVQETLLLNLVLTPRTTEHKSSTDAIEAMIATPDDVDLDDGQIEDATDRAGSGIALVSSSSRFTQRGGRRASEKTLPITTRVRDVCPRDKLELEARIEQIRARYRQQERVLKEEIARLEQTYRFALAELDAGQNQQAEDNGEWETTSEYPPTEPRGASRSPSPAFA